MQDSKKTRAQPIEEVASLQQKKIEGTGSLESAIIDSAMDAIIVVDEEHRIARFNRAAEEVFGYTARQAQGKPVHMLLPDELRDAHQRHLRQFGKTGVTSRSMRSLGTLSGLRSDGRVISVEASITQTDTPAGKFFAVILRDVSERQNLEDLILRQYESLNTLHLVTLNLLNHRNIKDLLQFIVDQAVGLLEVTYCEILLPDGDELVAHAFTRENPFTFGNRFKREDAKMSWQVFETGKPAVVDDYAVWANRQPIYEQEGFHAVAVLPLLVGEQCIGVLGMTRDKPGHTFTEEQILTATRLAAIAALAIENSRLLLEIRRLATTDELTGAHNRRSLLEHGEREVQRAARYQRPFSVLMLDLDHFKRINDTWGHLTGDVALREVVQEAMRQIRNTDMIGRYALNDKDAEGVIGRFGGEEFGVLLPECSAQDAMMVAERIRASVEEKTFHPAGQTDGEVDAGAPGFSVTLSLGVASMRSASDTLADILSRADQALYIAKQSGRNRVCSLAENQ
jgi:PAS domain S-box-containing protein